jgi:hypothetical protein
MSVKCQYCDKKFISSAHARSHADIAHPELMDGTDVELKRKGWVTPYGFSDWTYPVTYEYACEQMKAMIATIKWPEPKTE